MGKKKCYICESENVKRVFIKKKSRVKHYYCDNCADKYIIKVPKDDS